jgi:hypothetical protein
MTPAAKDIVQKLDAFAQTAKRLTDQCDAAIAEIEKMEARAAEAHKGQMAALDAMLALIDSFSGKIVVTKGDAK